MAVNNSTGRTKESKVPTIVVSSNESENRTKKQVKFLTEIEPPNENRMKKKIKRTSSWSPELAASKEKSKSKKKEVDKSNVKKTKVPPQKMELNTQRRNSVPPENVSTKANFKLKTKVRLKNFLAI